jgi:hypothetical protein
VAGGYADGQHNFGYWSTVIPAAFDFVSTSLALPSWRPRRPAAGR